MIVANERIMECACGWKGRAVDYEKHLDREFIDEFTDILKESFLNKPKV